MKNPKIRFTVFDMKVVAFILICVSFIYFKSTSLLLSNNSTTQLNKETKFIASNINKNNVTNFQFKSKIKERIYKVEHKDKITVEIFGQDCNLAIKQLKNILKERKGYKVSNNTDVCKLIIY